MPPRRIAWQYAEVAYSFTSSGRPWDLVIVELGVYFINVGLDLGGILQGLLHHLHPGAWRPSSSS